MTPEYLELDTLIYVYTKERIWKPRYVALAMPINKNYTVSVFREGRTSKTCDPSDLDFHHVWLTETEFLDLQQAMNAKYLEFGLQLPS